jgi:hypothetical protein
MQTNLSKAYHLPAGRQEYIPSGLWNLHCGSLIKNSFFLAIVHGLCYWFFSPQAVRLREPGSIFIKKDSVCYSRP